MLTFSDSIPGGRYTRLIEDINGPDADKKKAAQEFLKNLGGLDSEVQYDASVWFKFDTAKPLHALTFRGAVPSEDEIITRYKQANIVNAGTVSSTPLGGPSPGQIKKEIQNDLGAAMAELVSTPEPQPIYIITACETGNNDLITRESCLKLKDDAARERQGRADRSAARFMHAVDALYHDWHIPLEASVRSQPWPLFDERQTLFVLIPETDWQAHGGNIEVRALLHKAGDPTRPLPGTQEQSFSRDEWKLIHLQDSRVPSRDYRWAMRTMTDTMLLSSSTIEKIRAVREALTNWEKLHGAPK
jgi:hypothetical protein